MKTIPADQRLILRRSERAENGAERFVRDKWSELLRLLEDKSPGHWAEVYKRAGLIFRSMLTVGNHIAADLERMARDAHSHTVDHLAAYLPRSAFEDDQDEPRQAGPFTNPLDFIFRPINRQLVERIVFGSDWYSRFNQLSRLASPDTLAGIIANGIAQGLRPREIAAQIRPVVQGVQSTARRVARTEGMRVAHEVQMQTWEQVSDLIPAYQIHATLDENTRPEHRRRDGTIYYRHPKPGQLGFDKMPRPPIEADGSVAHNCRCFLTPIFSAEMLPKRIKM